MKILYLAHRLPYPPNKGDKIRSFHELEYLARGHRIWCACFIDDPADLRHVDSLSSHCEALAALPLNKKLAIARGLGHVLRGGTLTEGFYRDRRMRETVQRWSDSVGFDAVVVFSSSMAPYGLQCKAARRVIDFCDWDSLKWADYAKQHGGLRRRLFASEARRLRRLEVEWVRAFDAAVVITGDEASELQEPAIGDRVTVVRNGVALRPYAPPPVDPRVGFVGAMDYAPNVDAVCWFADRVWPGILAAVPRATFDIVGRGTTRRVRALAGLPGIRVLGEVPSVARHVDGFALTVAPLRIARGLQNKVLEAMSAGRAVVLTEQAARGIGGRDGVHYAVASQEDHMARTAVSLLDDRGRAVEMGAAARAFVESRFNWGREMARLESLLSVELAGATRPDDDLPRAEAEPPVPVGAGL